MHVHSDQQQREEEGQKEEAEGEEEEEFVIIYDRLANGWGGPPGQWGELDRVFSMRFRLV